MFQVSRNSPALYLTSVTHNRLPIFRTDKLKQVVCAALDEARKSGGFLIFAYVVMLDHIHLITDNARSTSDTLRFTNGIIAKRVTDYLKQNDFESCLAKLRIQVRDREHKHSVFQHHPNAFEIYGEDKMMEKVNYIHINPVRAGARIRGRGTLAAFEPITGGAQLLWSSIVDIEGEEKPACVAEPLARYFY